MRIVVTGSASRLAAVLLPQLAQDERIREIIGVDVCETEFRHPNFTQVLLDIRAREIGRLLKKTDAVVHLAFAPNTSGGDRTQTRDINVGGTQNLFNQAAQQRVARVVWLSSASVYELPARERNIGESHPRRALPGFGYAEDKVTVENWLDSFEREHPDTTVVRLRPHVIVGPHVPVFTKRLLRLPIYVELTKPEPRMQCVHEDDVVRAIVAALFKDVRGAFNLACADALSLYQIQRIRHNVLLPLPLPVARAALRLAWRFGIGGDPVWVEALRYHLVLDTQRARTRLGWRPKFDSVRDCLQASRSGAVRG